MRFILSILLACFCAGCVATTKQSKAIVVPPLPPPPIFLLQRVITNDVTEIDLPFTPYGDAAVSGCYWDTGDPRPLYGVRLTGLDRSGNQVTTSMVQESYVPPMTETVYVNLPPNVTRLRCEMFGPTEGKWSGGYLWVMCNQPKLSISQSGTNIVLSWFAPWGGWGLERRGTDTWTCSPATVPNEGTGLFRLKRTL